MEAFGFRRLYKLSLIFLFYIGMAVSAYGRGPEMNGHDFHSQWIVRDGVSLFLNGKAIHTVSIFSVKIYEISLLLEKPAADPEKILKSPERKVILLKFLRKVDADRLQSAFSSGFYENCGTRCESLKGYLNDLNSKIPTFDEGDALELQFLPARVVMKTSLGGAAEVNSPEFGQVLLSIWLGSSPPSEGLKRRILGFED